MEICQGSVHCLDKVAVGGEYRAVNTTRNNFEFLDLSFDSSYSMRLKSYAVSEPKVTYRTFVTPECYMFKQKYNIKLLNCRKSKSNQ